MINFAFSHPKRFEDKGEGRWHLGGSSRVILMDGGIPWEDVAACVNLLGEEYPRLGAAAQLRNVDALPGDRCIGIQTADDYTCKFMFQNGFGAGRGAPVMAAGFKGDIHGCACRTFGAVGQCVSFGVRLAAAGVPTLADDAALFDEHCADHRIGADVACAALCKRKRPPHIKCIVHVEFTSLIIKKSSVEKILTEQTKTVLKCAAFQDRKRQRNPGKRGKACHSSFIQTILSASEFHRIGALSKRSRAVPPVGNYTLP